MLKTECACTKLRRGARRVTKLYDVALAPYGLKVTQFSLLRTLDRLGETHLSALAGATGLERSTLGRNLRLLHELRLVELVGGDDLRTTVATISPYGRDAVKKATAAWERTQHRLKTDLGETKYSALFKILDSIEGLDM